MQKPILLLTLAALGCGFQNYATAGLIYSNGTPDNQNATDMSFNRKADDFTLGSGATVASARFWWAPHATGTVADFSGTITYAIYQNSAGAIGSQIAAGTVTGLTYTPTGGDPCSGIGTCPIQQTDFTLTSPVALAAGTYWLELHEGTSTTDFDGASIYWATSADGSGNALTDLPGGCPSCNLPTFAQNREFAFQLFDAQVPEPGTMGLAAAGLAALAWLRRRRG